MHVVRRCPIRLLPVGQKDCGISKEPAYAVESFDNALKLLTLLQKHGWLRIADAAAELGVAPSTTHRIMAMLVYRGFALQDEQRRYGVYSYVRDNDQLIGMHGDDERIYVEALHQGSAFMYKVFSGFRY